MLFNEFTLTFLVVRMLGHVTAESNEIPICDPPALTCSILKRSVCEWSDSGQPVWACRGYFETVNSGPKPPQQKTTGDGNDEDVVTGTYEYQIPQGSNDSVSHNDLESNEVQFITYTYPISKAATSAASKVESQSEVKNGTYTLPVSSGKNSSTSKVESGSEVRIVTHSLPVAGSGSAEVVESNSSAQMKIHTHQAPSTKMSSGSKVETGTNVQFGTYALPLMSGKNNYISHGESNSGDVHIETYTIRVPTIKNSSESKLESDAEVQIGTYTLQVPGSSTGEVAHAGDVSDVQVGTHTYQIPFNETTTSKYKSESEMQVGLLRVPVSSGISSSTLKVESESEMQSGTDTPPLVKSNNGEAVRVESDSDVQMVTYTNQVPSIKNSSISHVTSEDTVQMGTSNIPSKSSSVTTVHSDPESSTQIGTYTNQVSSDKNSSGSRTESEVQLVTYTYPVLSSKSSASSDTDSESNIQSGTYHVNSSRNTVTSGDDSESKLLAKVYANQANTESSDSQVSAASEVKIGTASSSASSQNDTESQIGIHEVQVSSAQSGSQSQEQTRTNVDQVPSAAENSGIQSGSDSNVQLTSQSSVSGKSGSSVLHADSEAQLGIGSVVQSDMSEKNDGSTLVESGASANGAVQIGQALAILGLHQTPSLTAEASSLNGFRTAGHQGFQTIGLGQAKFGRGLYPSLIGTRNANGAPNQLHIPGFPMLYNAQQYYSQMNGNAGSLHAAGTYSQSGGSQYSAGNGYSTKSSDGSQTSENQAYSMGNIMSPYHLTSDKAAATSGGRYQQYQANSAAGSGSVHKNYGNGAQNRQTYGHPYYGNRGYQSLEQGSASPSSNQLASSGNDMYYWPQWTPPVNMGLRGYGDNWFVGHIIPLINPAHHSVGQQYMAKSTNANLYGSRSLNSASDSAATSTTSSHHSPWFYITPVAQYVSSRALGIDLTSCSFCKKLTAMFGGTKICDLLEPIILEFFNNLLEIFRKGLN